MSRLHRILPASAAALALAVGAVAAAPSADTTDVTVDGSSVSVVGTLADALGSTVIGTDDVGDANGSGSGVDLAQYAVSFPEAGIVAFEVTLGDANPGTGYLPQGMAIEITPTVGEESVELTVNSTLDAGLRFGSQTCAVNPDTGVNECSSEPVEGSYEDGVLTWLLPTAAAPGAVINGNVAHSNLYVGTGATGGVTFVNGILDAMGITAFATLPSATLFVDGEPVATSSLSDAGYALEATDLAEGERALTVELCGAAADFDGNATECLLVDLGTVVVGAPVAS